MTPLASVILADGGTGDARALIEPLRAQTESSWEAIEAHDPNDGIDRARGEFVLFMRAGAKLEPGALGALVAAARSIGAAAGRSRLYGPHGEALGDAVGPTGDIGLAELLGCCPFAMHAQIIRRDLLGGVRFQTGLASGADHDLWLRLARRGVRWACVPETIASHTLLPPATDAELHAKLLARVRVLREADPAGACGASRALRTALATLAVAATPAGDLGRLRDITASLKSGGDIHLAQSSAFPSSATATLGPLRWWQRGSFIGPMARTVALHTRLSVGTVVGAPSRASQVLLDQCEPGRDIVLLGLGKNARQIARLMQDRGVRIRGRDDQLNHAPQWARHEGVDVELISKNAPYDAAAQYIMTVLNDADYLATLPPGLNMLRWAETLARIESEKEEWLTAWAAA